MRFGMILAASVGASLLAGCVNLEAVRTYSEAASDVVGNTQPAARWRDSEKQLRSFKLDGDKCDIGRPNRLPQERFDQAFAEVVVVHKALADYFTAIGELAVDELPKTEKTAAGSLDALKKAGANVKDEEKAAVLALFKVLDRSLDAYRHKKLRELMVETHEDVATILGLLQRLADVYAGEIGGERIQAVNFIRCSRGQKDLNDPYLARRELKRVEDYYGAEQKKVDQYKAALTKISVDHARVRDALALSDRKQVEKTLREIASTAKELRAAQEAISSL